MDAKMQDVPARTLLVVDDEPLMTEILSLQMTKHGFRTVTADCVSEALKIIDAGETPIDIILTDMNMPQGDGIDLARALCDRHLDIPVLIASGYPADETAALPSNVVGVIEKPFQYKAVAERFRQILDANS